MKHLRTIDDLSPDDVEAILARTQELKTKLAAGERPLLLAGRQLSLVFEKPSLRTRVSFETAMTHLGGGSSFLTMQEAGMQGRESLPDVARVLSGFSDAIALRTFSQQLIDDVAAVSSCPVINSLSDDRHPCQTLTDLFTLREIFSEIRGKKIAYIGDGNNIARSLSTAAAMTGMAITIASPPGFELESDFLDDLRQRFPAAIIEQLTDPKTAVREADVVYTDVWASMGQESEAAQRRTVFAPYQVNADLMSQAPPGCIFMHDLPAHRGEEVTAEVLDGPQSVAFQQAENRMHLAKGLLTWLLQS